MFGLKKNPNNLEQKSVEPVHDIGVIPDIFYGGNDPDIYNEKETASTSTAAATNKKSLPSSPVEKKEPGMAHPLPPRRLPPPPLSPPVGVPDEAKVPPLVASRLNQPVSPQKSGTGKVGFALLFLVVFLAIAAGAAWFFFFRTSSPSPITDEEPQPVEDTPLVTLPPIENPVVTSTFSTSTPEIAISPTSSIQRERSLPFLSLVNPIDTDSDKLSTPEEELFQTDPETFDTDDDGYFDGQEVLNLYNPKGFAPMRIIDSGLVQEYVNPTLQYRVYYPISWLATPIDSRDNKQVLLSGIFGDYIQIKAYDKQIGETFPGWFGRVVGDQVYTDLVATNNRFSIPLYRRKDGLVSYFDTQNTVYIIVLYSRDENKNDYPHLMDMVVQSFRPGKSNQELPPQIILPVPGGTIASTTVSSTTSSSVR